MKNQKSFALKKHERVTGMILTAMRRQHDNALRKLEVEDLVAAYSRNGRGLVSAARKKGLRKELVDNALKLQHYIAENSMLESKIRRLDAYIDRLWDSAKKYKNRMETCEILHENPV